MRSNPLLAAAAILSVAAAGFQALISFVPGWSAYFGAPSWLLARPALLIVAGLGAAAALAACAAYAASGAGHVRPLPHLRKALVAIGTVLLMRGLLLVPLTFPSLGMMIEAEGESSSGLCTSAFAFLLGVLYLSGTLFRWRELGEATPTAARRGVATMPL
jgi:heme/copper-type cytochrome/quinol oxidase subunit 3